MAAKNRTRRWTRRVGCRQRDSGTRQTPQPKKKGEVFQEPTNQQQLEPGMFQPLETRHVLERSSCRIFFVSASFPLSFNFNGNSFCFCLGNENGAFQTHLVELAQRRPPIGRFSRAILLAIFFSANPSPPSLNLQLFKIQISLFHKKIRFK